MTWNENHEANKQAELEDVQFLPQGGTGTLCREKRLKPEMWSSSRQSWM